MMMMVCVFPLLDDNIYYVHQKHFIALLFNSLEKN